MMVQRSLRLTTLWSKVSPAALLNFREIHYSRDTAKLRQLSRRVRVLEQRVNALLPDRTKSLDQSKSTMRGRLLYPPPNRGRGVEHSVKGSKDSALPPPPRGVYPPLPYSVMVRASLLSILLTLAIWVIVGPVFILLPFGLFAALTIFL